MNKFLFPLLLMIALAGCKTAAPFLLMYDQQPQPMLSKSQLPKANRKLPTAVKVIVKNISQFPDSTCLIGSHTLTQDEVSNKKSVNHYQLLLGENSLASSVNSYTKKAIEKTIQHGGFFQVANMLEDSALTLEFTIRQLAVSGNFTKVEQTESDGYYNNNPYMSPYRNNLYGSPYGINDPYYHNRSSSKTHTYIKSSLPERYIYFEARLIGSSNQVIYHRSYQVEGQNFKGSGKRKNKAYGEEGIKKLYLENNLITEEYMRLMVEEMTSGFQECIDKMIKDTNVYILRMKNS